MPYVFRVTIPPPICSYVIYLYISTLKLLPFPVFFFLLHLFLMTAPSHSKRSRKEVRLGKNPDVVYCEEDRIGQGQFGTVYRGLCPATNTVVAVKLLRDLLSAGNSEVVSRGRTAAPETETTHDSKNGATTAAKPRPRFPSELELLWTLRGDHCPNIVHVLSVWNKPRKHHSNASGNAGKAAGGGESDGANQPSSASAARTADTRERHSNVYVLVTEYCEGGDLQHRLQALDSNVPAHVARSFTYQLCNALYTLKRRRIVHRDIKPANLLLSTRDWETATLKVADFGMAKAAPVPKAVKSDSTNSGREDGDAAAAATSGLLHDGDDDESSTLPSTLFYSEMGTPMYMSPERIAGQPYDYKADVYSAGMVLLEMMRGACVRVTRVSQLRTMVPETIQRMRVRYTAKGEAPPAWLDLVQRMTATDPALRYSVEDVLRHTWFTEAVGPALPPLTFALPPEAQQRKAVGTAVNDAAAEDTAVTVAATSDAAHEMEGVHGVDSSPGQPAATTAATMDPSTVAAADAPSSNPAPNDDAVHETVTKALPSPTPAEAAATTASGGCRRQEPLSHWTLLGVCAGIDPRHNTARCVYTGLVPKSRHGAPLNTTTTTTATTAVQSTAFSLPAACGPHIITHAVRGFVDAVYLYVLQDELDPVGGLTLVSFLVELVQNGFGTYLECLESLGGANASSTVATTPNTSTTLVADSGSGNNAVCVNGHRFVVKDVGGLPEVWRQLMVRLSHAQAVYKAQLPSRMLQDAALWRRRVLTATLPPANAAGGGNEPAEAREAENSRLYADLTSSSEGEAAMPGLPNVASITNVSVAAAASAAAEPAAATSSSPPLRVYTLSTRAEQLIFAKAVDCVQTEALAALMAAPVLPSHESAALSAEDRRASAHSGDGNPLDAADCLEEEEAAAAAAARARCSRAARGLSSAPSAPFVASPAGRRRRPSWSATLTAANAVDVAAAMPSHRGIALLRVLLQRAVLNAAEVGLESESLAATTRSAPLDPSAVSPVASQRGGPANLSTTPPPPSCASPPAAAVGTSLEASDAEPGGCAFVVQVPVYATLQPSDVQVVESLLCAATRVFINACNAS